MTTQMFRLCVVLALAAAAALPATGDEPTTSESTPRKPNPLAPSLPLLTEKEEAQLDALIDRFILYDTGRLTGEEGTQALKQFHKLGPVATFALVRGMNKAADIDHASPALTIGGKLKGIAAKTKDTQLLLYLKENVGLGVTGSRHQKIINEVKRTATYRYNQLKRSGAGR